MSRRAQRAGSLIILLFMALLGLFTAGCIITTNINVGHHLAIDKDVRAEDVLLDQRYETAITGNKR